MTHQPNFRIETSRKGTSKSIALAGELDGAAAAVLTGAFARALDEHDEGDLILDMEKLSFIDSAGLRAIIHIERAAQERRVPLVVTPPPAPVTELLRTAGLSERLSTGPQPSQTIDDGGFTERVELTLPLDDTAPGRARYEVRELIGDRPDDILAVAALLTSELVTNAVIHPRQPESGGVRLRITTSANRVRVEVFDRGPGFDPERPRRREPDRGGRGLLLVDQLASRWGARHVEDGAHDDERGFAVWFELDHAADHAIVGRQSAA